MQPSKRSIEKGNDNTVILEGIMIYVNGVEDVEAQFTYNGSSVSVNYSDGSYQRGFLSIWQVSDFKDSSVSSITVDGVYYARVKSSANFHYGLEIQGVGLVIQDNYCWVDARCSKTGTVKGCMDA